MRSAALRRCALILLKASPIGLRLGEYFGQIDRRRTRFFDRFGYADDLVYRQIVHEYNFAALEGGDEALPDIGEKQRPLHGSLRHKRRGQSALPPAAHESDGFPMFLGRVIADRSPRESPRAAQPHYCVFVQVSSMNTSRAASNMSYSRLQRRRACVTSGRFCFAAYRFLLNAHSTVKCNGQISGAEENLARGLVAEYLSGARVEFVLDPLDIGIGQNREVGTFWEVLPEEAVSVFVEAAFPRVIGLGKIG